VRIKAKNCLFFLLIFFSLNSFSASVIQVKNDKVLIDVSDTTVQIGEKRYLMNEQDKKVTLIEITGIRGDRAVGKILKGKARLGLTLNEGNAAAAAAPTRRSRSDNQSGFSSFGGLVGSVSNTMTISAQTGSTTDTLNLKGNSFLIKGFGDYEWSGITIRLVGGLHTYAVTGSPSATTKQAVCSNSSTCEIKYNYFSAEAHAMYSFTETPHRYWVSGGYMFLYATSASSTVGSLDTGNKMNSVFAFQGGADFNISRDAFIPVFFQYGLFAGGSGVAANSTSFYGGYGVRF
jgi:hypothetical protein